MWLKILCRAILWWRSWIFLTTSMLLSATILAISWASLRSAESFASVMFLSLGMSSSALRFFSSIFPAHEMFPTMKLIWRIKGGHYVIFVVLYMYTYIYIYIFFFYIKRHWPRVNKNTIKKIPLVAKPDKEDSRRKDLFCVVFFFFFH